MGGKQMPRAYYLLLLWLVGLCILLLLVLIAR